MDGGGSDRGGPEGVGTMPTNGGRVLPLLLKSRSDHWSLRLFYVPGMAGLETEARRELCAYRNRVRNAHARAQTDRMSV